jgi:nucleotide-binding universal stress UspA family protein
MTYRNILVQADTTTPSLTRSRLAAQLAGRFGAHLTGVFLKTEFLRQYMVPEAISGLPAAEIDRLVKEHEDAVSEAAEHARLSFEAAAAQAGVSSDWLVVSGDTPEDLMACARRMDLAILPTATTPNLGQQRITAAEIALGGGGPVLVVPDAVTEVECGKRVLIAWNGSKEASRALRDAWPLIQQAETVNVLIVSPHGDTGPESLLQRHLERHGCNANITVDRSEDASAGEVLRQKIRELKADLVVMGLYGHARLQELVLGGVSRDLLKSSPAPLLVAH